MYPCKGYGSTTKETGTEGDCNSNTFSQDTRSFNWVNVLGFGINPLTRTAYNDGYSWCVSELISHSKKKESTDVYSHAYNNMRIIRLVNVQNYSCCALAAILHVAVEN
jgi:hypothetical protein